jgi:DNA-binding GntR family transcriptional regulator
LEEVIMIGLRARDLVVHTAAPGDHAISLHAAVLEAVRAQERAVAERTMLELLDTAARDSEAYAGISQG